MKLFQTVLALFVCSFAYAIPKIWDDDRPYTLDFYHYASSMVLGSACMAIAHTRGYGYQNCAWITGIWTGAFRMTYDTVDQWKRTEFQTGTILNGDQTVKLSERPALCQQFKQFRSWIAIESALREGLDSSGLEYITTDLRTDYATLDGMMALNALFRYDILVGETIARVHLQFDQVDNTMALVKELDDECESEIGSNLAKDQVIVVNRSMKRFMAEKIVNPEPRGFWFWYGNSFTMAYATCGMIAYNQGYGYKTCGHLLSCWTGIFAVIYGKLPATIDNSTRLVFNYRQDISTFEQSESCVVIDKALAHGLVSSRIGFKTKYVNPGDAITSFRYDFIVNDAVTNRLHVRVDCIKNYNSSIEYLDDAYLDDKCIDDNSQINTNCEASTDDGNEVGESTEPDFPEKTYNHDEQRLNEWRADVYNYPLITTNQCVASKNHNSGDIFRQPDTCSA